MFDTLYKNMKQYWNSGNKADTWEYFYDKVLKALNINYVSNKVLKREEERKRQLEEEELKKKEKEEKEMKEKFELMNKELKDQDQNKINNMIYNSESTATNNITDNNRIEDKKVEKKVLNIKKIKITKEKDSKAIKNKINLKDEGITNETTT